MISVLPAPFIPIHLTEVDSTQTRARALALQGAQSWTVVLADRQTGGRGRFDRPWQSQMGNLHMTLVLRTKAGEPPAGTPVGLINLVCGLAVADAVAAMADRAPVALKWPNDVLVGDAKICGILTELVELPPAGGAVLIMGVGINLAAHPEGTLYPTCHLGEFMDRTPSVEEALAVFLPILHRYLTQFLEHGFAALRDVYLGRLRGIGEPISVAHDAAKQDRRSGILRGIDMSGCLLLETGQGVEVIAAGDVLFGGQ